MKRLAESPLRHLSPLVPLVLMVGFAKLNWEPTTGVIIQGALIGSLSALLAVGIALIYRANRIVNFAQGDLGVAPALLVILLMAADAPGGAPDWMTGLPYFWGLALGLAAALLLGFVVERTFVNRFKNAPRLILTVATIGVAQLLTALALFMPRWFGFKTLQLPSLDPPFEYQREIGGVIFDQSDFMVFVSVPVLLLALTAFLRYTRAGIAVRAAAERSDRAATLGVPVPRIQTTVWVITTVLAFITIFLRAGVVGFPYGSALGITILVRALAAAVIGRMHNFATITAAAIGLGVVEQSIIYDLGRDIYVFPWLFAIIVIALLFNRRQRASRVEDQNVSTWQAAHEMRPVPRELRALPEVKAATYTLFGAIAALALSMPFWMSNSKLFIAIETGNVAIIAVSLVILTGWAGHLSLGQMAFAAIGGAVGGWVTQTAGWDLGYALVAGGLVGAAVAVVIGIPAARAGGLTLAVVTLALASAVLYWLLNPEFFGWAPRGRFERTPELFGTVELDSQNSYYWLTLAMLVLSIAMAYGIRRSRTGRVIIALRENPRGAEAYGINAIRTMLVAFAFSGFLAAMAGVLMVHHERGLSTSFTGNPFSAEASLRIFTIVVIGGLASIPGAIIGTLYVFAMQYYMLPEFRFLASGIGLLLILLILPGGLGAGFGEARDAGLRWVARRRRMIVPSMLADRRVDTVEVTPAMAAAVAEAVERPEIEEVAGLQQ